ncbi:serine O-acetyltransferase EpsC [Herbaspirillum rubrisubalbicans]|uniref:Serine acetyltransferase n=1 Tax=Herbaspirillum rubrisubalbicans TaxID=80842 RepID=A0AAD0U7F9_9BURK|nr:serine O-acetyltransferase EpsC [Herbaspirillum rubrisubalbicans]ALU88691.1 serine O-acetyltransferase protein [Herbaspirillum rubrisubalbicans M1]AYR23741.1 serine acetyltransferase [Herbaspirillum rubrisubalbicans]
MDTSHTPELNALAESAGLGLSTVVAGLRTSREVTNKIRYRGEIRELPSREAMQKLLHHLQAALFPTHYGHTDLSDETIDYFVGSQLNAALAILREQVRRSLYFSSEIHEDALLRERATVITRDFAHQLPAVRDILVSDIQAAYHGDPAASSISEILLCYPGTTAIIYHRLAHALHQLGAPLLARLIADIAHSATGIDIHPAAQIGPSFFIDHGTGVVIGETTIIGRNVRLYQAVTLGAKRFPQEPDGSLVKGIARHPIVEDDVVVYAGATLLGRITIGQGSVIGGNVWLTHSVPPGSNISQAEMLSDCRQP